MRKAPATRPLEVPCSALALAAIGRELRRSGPDPNPDVRAYLEAELAARLESLVAKARANMAQHIIDKAKALPPEAQAQVIDLIDRLSQPQGA